MAHWGQGGVFFFERQRGDLIDRPVEISGAIQLHLAASPVFVESAAVRIKQRTLLRQFYTVAIC
jgi:hypothetical protein